MKQGERQVADTLKAIDRSHLARYQFATKFIKPSDNVLDFGCGVGYGSFILSKICNEVVAIDKDPEAIEFADEHYASDNICYRTMEVITEVDYYDLAVCFEVIEHVDNTVTVIYEIANSLKSGGLLIVSTPDERVMPYSSKNFPFHKRHYKQKQFADLLNFSPFTIEKKFNQKSKCEYAIRHGWGGSYNIALCRKQ